jgi:hypothetical protein
MPNFKCQKYFGFWTLIFVRHLPARPAYWQAGIFKFGFGASNLAFILLIILYGCDKGN